MPPHVLGPNEHAVLHAVQGHPHDERQAVASEVDRYEQTRAQLAALAPGAPEAEGLLRVADGFVLSAHNR